MDSGKKEKGNDKKHGDKSPDAKKIRKIDQELLNACYFGNARLVKKLIEKGADVEYVEDRDGWLPLHYACRWGDVGMMMTLIKAGANIDGRTNSKESSLHKCGRWDRKECAIVLLKLGANPHFKNNDGMKASDMTTDNEMKFLLDHFDEYMELKRADDEKKKMAEDRKNKTLMEEKRAQQLDFTNMQRRFMLQRRRKSLSVARSPSPADNLYGVRRESFHF